MTDGRTGASDSALATKLHVVEASALRFVETGEDRVDSWDIDWEQTPEGTEREAAPPRPEPAPPQPSARPPRREEALRPPVGHPPAPAPRVDGGLETLPALFVGVHPSMITEGMRHFFALDVHTGQTLAAQGERQPALVLPLRGQLESVRSSRRRRVPSGAVLGLTTLYGSGAWPSTVRALSDCRLLVLELEGYQRLRREANPLSLVIEEYALETLLDRALTAAKEVAQAVDAAPLGDLLPTKTFLQRLAAVFGAGGLSEVEVDATRALLASPLFRNADEDDVRAIAGRTVGVSAGTGELLTTQGEESSSLFLVVSGRVDRISAAGAAKAVRHDSLGPGDLFGAWSVLRSAPAPMSCVAMEKTVLLELDKLAWAELGTASDATGSVLRLALLRAITRQLHLAQAQLAAIEGGGVPVREAAGDAGDRFVTIDPAARR